MSSQVNPSTINPNFPVPGVNQPSQGFRSNFLAIQNFAAQYVAEMNDLINKAIVSAPLTYGNLSSNINNFGGMNNSNLAIYDFAYGSLTPSANNISTSGTLTLDCSKASYFPYNLTSSSVQTVSINNYTGLGYSEVVLDITASAVPQYINLATLTSGSTITCLGSVPIPGFNSTTSNLAINNVGRNEFVLGSLDGTAWVLWKKNMSATARQRTPASAVGAPGDTSGQIVYDGSYIYVCTNNYDGASSIWYRAAITVV